MPLAGLYLGRTILSTFPLKYSTSCAGYVFWRGCRNRTRGSSVSSLLAWGSSLKHLRKFWGTHALLKCNRQHLGEPTVWPYPLVSVILLPNRQVHLSCQGTLHKAYFGDITFPIKFIACYWVRLFWMFEHLLDNSNERLGG